MSAPVSAPMPAAPHADTVTPSPARPPSGHPAAISRRELQRHLERGAHHFIQQVRVRALFRRGKFWGWRILAYQAPGPVKPGDVVQRVNGSSLERPEQFMTVWNSLGTQPALRVELVRAGKPLTLDFLIVD